MNTSDDIGALASALAKAQGEIQNPHKDAVNSHFRSRYADLSGGLEAIRPALAKHELAFVQTTARNGDDLALITRLMHASGQWIESTYPVCKIGPRQIEMGSALTFARRYALFALVGIAGSDDEATDGMTADQRAYAEAAEYVARAKDHMAGVKQLGALRKWFADEKKNRDLHKLTERPALAEELLQAYSARGNALTPAPAPEQVEAAE